MSPVIDVSDLRKAYDDHPAVDGVTFAVEEGERFGILGPNGAGKTTTLEIIEGLRPADSGSVTLLGETPWPRRPDLLGRVGVQLQTSAFFEKLTAGEQVRTFAELYGAPRAQADEWLAEVGLEHKADSRTEDLSGGQKQRLSLACSLVHEPEVLFLDEPTAALDPQARRNLWDLLGRLNASGRTVVLTTHHMDEAEVLCDRVAIMDHGKILALDTPAALVRALAAPVRISVVAAALPVADAEAIAAGGEVRADGDSVVITTERPEEVLGALAQRGALEGLQVRGATLEDVFLDLTGREYRA